MDTIWIAVVATVVSPAILAFITGYQTRQGKKQDYARQDQLIINAEAVATKAAEAAELLVKSNNERARETKANAVQVTGQLKVIHTLVNSNMTNQKQDTLNATKRELAQMKMVLSLSLAQGHNGTETDMRAAIEETQVRINELQVELDERRAQDLLALQAEKDTEAEAIAIRHANGEL